jgi:uroporphyrinogen-III synthase
MKLIITRPKADAEALVPKLATLGHDALICPLMEIRQRADVQLPDIAIQAVCASSANGLDADIDWRRLTHLPFLAVGPQSAEAARRRGFETIAIAQGGNLQSLATLIAEKLAPATGAVLYLSGQEISGDLAALVRPSDIHVERLIVYDALEIVPDHLAQMIADANGVLLYSPRAARLWLNAAAAAQADVTAKLHFCLSQNVAAQLPQLLPISVAGTPDESGMMELLDRDPRNRIGRRHDT